MLNIFSAPQFSSLWPSSLEYTEEREEKAADLALLSQSEWPVAQGPFHRDLSGCANIW